MIELGLEGFLSFFEGVSSMNINEELPDPLHLPPYSWNSHTRTFIRLTNLLLLGFDLPLIDGG